MGNPQPANIRVAPAAPRRQDNAGFALLTPAFLDELRLRTSLSALIGRTVKLQKAGNEYKACCPFHTEKSPSFYVNDDKAFYHCFGCGAHGDAIRFLTEARGLSFIDAVKELAQAAGMEMPEPTPEARERAERTAGLHEIMAAAERWFADQLNGLAGGEARAYIAKRGISAEAQSTFKLGFAPDARNRLKTALEHLDVSKLVEAGLLIQPEEDREPYDRFRGRLMIPIRDARGRTIAFGGRVIGDGEPKYLNSPETPLFDKGRTLFNLDRAAPASRRTDRLFVVEGYLDAIALDQVGLSEVVAPLGTALTEEQMVKLWQLIDAPTLCFDGDAAGQRAATKAALRALPILRLGKSLKFVTLPNGQDPDDVVQRGGAAAWERVTADPLPLVSLLYASERAGVDESSPDDRARLRGRLEQLADTCGDRLVATEYRRTLISRFYEDFGWKKRERAIIANAAVRTGPREAPDLMRLFVRSTLYGLTRYPMVAAKHMEAVSRLKSRHSSLMLWRDAILDALVKAPDLDGDGINAILETKIVPDELRFDLTTDLRFGFVGRNSEAMQAISQLEALVQVLSDEPELDEEIDRLNAAVEADTGLESYEALEADRQRIRTRILALRSFASDVGAGELDIGS